MERFSVSMKNVHVWEMLTNPDIFLYENKNENVYGHDFYLLLKSYTHK